MVKSRLVSRRWIHKGRWRPGPHSSGSSPSALTTSKRIFILHDCTSLCVYVRGTACLASCSWAASAHAHVLHDDVLNHVRAREEAGRQTARLRRPMPPCRHCCLAPTSSRVLRRQIGTLPLISWFHLQQIKRSIVLTKSVHSRGSDRVMQVVIISPNYLNRTTSKSAKPINYRTMLTLGLPGFSSFFFFSFDWCNRSWREPSGSALY
jgi:hypothetical protein